MCKSALHSYLVLAEAKSLRNWCYGWLVNTWIMGAKPGLSGRATSVVDH